MKLLSVLILIGLCEAAFAFRCGNQIVSVGDTRYEVSAICGSPDDAISNIAYRSLANGAVYDCDPVRTYRVDALGMESGASTQPAPRSCVALVEDRLAVQVDVEVWLYDFGKNRFMQQVHFENGRVVRIEKLGYGVKPRR